MSHKENTPCPERCGKRPDRAAPPAVCIQSSSKAAQARLEGTLQPDLAYTLQKAKPGPKGWVESDATVCSKQKSKEQFPQG